jgi:ubiquinone/menaquinone biosynthesis C-methylase UbiE
MLTEFFLKRLNRKAASPGFGAERILDSLGLPEGGAVADIGSGGGFFALAFARKVGGGGKVYAVDNNRKYLEFVRREAGKAGLGNIVFVLAGDDGAGLPEASVDLVFARNVFHHMRDPGRYFRGVRKALKPGGSVAVIDYLPERRSGFLSRMKHSTPVETIRRTMESAGYRLRASHDFLKEQSFTVWSAE